ncbi:MAG: hypothetical protein IJ192_13790 [Clostridia bacterium]|nr:hypothetical protein [Clostridia bacterium]
MGKQSLSGILKSVQMAMKKHSPEILTGIGIAGMITTTVMAVKATPKALILIEEKKSTEKLEELPSVEIVKTAWFCYIPTAITGVLSIACLVGASSVNLKRNAALATAYTLSETALKEYKDKVVEVIGEKKAETVKDAIAKDKIEKDPVSAKEIIITEHGNTLCYDVLSGRYFKSDIDKLKKIENELNRKMLSETYITLNEFYSEMGLNEIKLGNELGWNINSNGFISLEFSSQLSEDGTPCLVLGYHVAPRYDFY